MSTAEKEISTASRFNLLDFLLYSLTGGVLLAMSFSFFLWLQF